MSAFGTSRKSYPPSIGSYPEPEFDPWDEATMHDVVGVKRLIQPITDLLVLEAQIKVTEDSFGVNAEKLAQMVIPMLKKLREACVEEFKDQL